MELRLETENISKRFGSVLANNKLTLSFSGGNVYALLGENGAGKTTYLNILFGIYEPDEGKLLLNGNRLEFNSPKEAISRGIYLVQQNFSLIENFTVAENLAILEKPSLKSLNLSEVVDRARSVAEKNGLHIDFWAKIEKMPMSFRQRAEILKGLFCDARILLLDEPTSVLGPMEVDELGKSFKMLASDGRIIIFTSHKLEQVIRFSDHVVVLRDGQHVVSKKTADVSNVWELAQHMVGEEFAPHLPEKEATGGEIVLEAENVEVRDDKGRTVVDDVSLTARKGEILGIAGVAGNGQKQLAEALMGLTKVHGGSVEINGTSVTGILHGGIRRKGVGYIPEEGALVGVVPDFTVTENFSLTTYDLETSSPLLNSKMFAEKAEKLIQEYGINPPDKDLPARYLSGGNLHKLIVARELARPLNLLIAYNPTKGLDIRATALVRRKILEKRNSGASVILISEDLEEILELSDRIAVMYEGRIVGRREAHEVDIKEVGRMMSGRSQ